MESMIYEQQAHEQGFALVCGVDEAGAGPLMGPLYAAAVILPEQFDLPGLNDSKKLTEKKREALFPLIQQQAVAWAGDHALQGVLMLAANYKMICRERFWPFRNL